MAGLLDDFAELMVKQSIDRTDPKKPSVPLSSQVLSALQGASNAAASNLSAPVDGIAWLLRKAGLPIPSNPVGGSDWMAQQGLTREPQNRNAGLLGEAIGGVLPMVAAAKAPQIAKGLLQVEANAMAPRTLNKETGAIVWHGSPHKFDKFDASKIGTGEGGQSYGHGLYLAENPRVADTYAKYGALGTYAKSPNDFFHNGERYVNFNGKIEKQLKNGDWVDSTESEISSAFDKAAKEFAFENKGVGQLYKVDLPDEHIAKMLDWDKPLSQQPEAVRESLAKKYPEYFNSGWMESSTGSPAIDAKKYGLSDADLNLRGFSVGVPAEKVTAEAFYRDLASRGVGDMAFQKGGHANASTALRELGIPGIRYLDGGSRGTGAGTSNFVVFPGNEGLLSILERNGQPIK